MKRLLTILALAALAGCGSESSGNQCGATTPASCPSEAPSYKTDVAPLLQKYCVSCHSASGQEPSKPLDTHAGVSGISGDVKSEVASCGMPPAGSTAPTDAERDTILAWLVCGAQDN